MKLVETKYTVVWAYSGDLAAGPFDRYEHAKAECDRLEKVVIYPVTIRTTPGFTNGPIISEESHE